MTNTTDTVSIRELDQLAGGVTNDSARTLGSRAYDYLMDLIGMVMPVLALGIPAAGFMAYTNDEAGQAVLALSVLVMLPILYLMRSFAFGADTPTLLSPLMDFTTMGHMLLVCLSMGFIPIYGFMVVIGAGTGNLPLFESVTFLVFALANGAYVASYCNS